jgi:hypothetical protein
LERNAALSQEDPAEAAKEFTAAEARWFARDTQY